jgi:hypothetical protein
MPTPFNHLLAARDFLEGAALDAPVRRALAAEWPAFLLGNIAPDVQTVSGQTREATHFFPVPIGGAPRAHRLLFQQHPSLAAPARLPSAQAAFLTGYLLHLEFDQCWVTDIFAPVFGPEQTWRTFRERLYLHNALRAHWDASDLARLPDGIAPQLSAACPEAWLPFVSDAHLAAWRDQVADQLHLGAARTVEIFAERMGVDALQFGQLVNTPEAMERRVFVRVSREQLARYRERALARSLTLAHAYWQGRFEGGAF